MNYPVNCKNKNCNQQIYGPVTYCPFCGTASVDIAAEYEKNGEILRAIINKLIAPNTGYVPSIRRDILAKGKEIGLDEKTSDSLLLEVLKERNFIPESKEADDPLSISWYSAEFKPTIIEKTTQKSEKEVSPELTMAELTVDKPDSPETTMPLTKQKKEQAQEIKITEEKQEKIETPKKKKTYRIVFVTIVMVVGYFLFNNFIGTSKFIGDIDRALADKRYLSPPGNNVADLFLTRKAIEPGSSELKNAASRIRQKLEPLVEDVFQRLYKDSDDSDWDNTVDIYTLLSKIVPDDQEISAKALFCRAHKIVKGEGQRNYIDALDCYRKALALKPNWVFAINGIAKVYIRKDSPYYNRDAALNWYNKVSEVDQNFPWAYVNIAAIYSEDKKWDIAEQFLLKAWNLKKNSPNILTELGKMCEKQNKIPEAMRYFEEAIRYEKNPGKIEWLRKKINFIQ